MTLLDRRSFMLAAAAAVPIAANALTVDYVQAHYLFIPRVVGQNPETGTYRSFPAGGIQFATGITAPNPNGNWWPMYLPQDFPQVCLVNQALIACASGNPAVLNENVSEITVCLDYGGQYYASAGGAEAGGIFIRQGGIARARPQWNGRGLPFIYKTLFPADVPFLFNRSAGDMIEVTCSFTMPMDWLGIVIGYLKPNTFQPQ